MASADAAKSTEATPSAPLEPRETPVASEAIVSTSAGDKQEEEEEEKKPEDVQASQPVDGQPEQSEDVIQSIEVR